MAIQAEPSTNGTNSELDSHTEHGMRSVPEHDTHLRVGSTLNLLIELLSRKYGWPPDN